MCIDARMIKSAVLMGGTRVYCFGTIGLPPGSARTITRHALERGPRVMTTRSNERHTRERRRSHHSDEQSSGQIVVLRGCLMVGGVGGRVLSSGVVPRR